MEWTSRNLVMKIRDACRAAAEKIDGFTAGTIRIVINPLNEEAREWLGGFDDAELELVFPVRAGGSTVVETNVDARWNYTYRASTYSVTSMKVASCALAYRLGKSQLSGRARFPLAEVEKNGFIDANLTPNRGYTDYRGCVCLPVFDYARPGKIDFCRIFVAVSGAKQDQDETVALAAVDVVESWLAAENADQKHHLNLKRP